MYRILVVDDSVDQVLAVGQSLMAHHEVLVATSGSEALQVVHRQQPDLLILDVQMPDIDGLTVLQQLRACAATEQLPVIMLSADACATLRRQALAAGAFDLLVKPVDIGLLRAMILYALKYGF